MQKLSIFFLLLLSIVVFNSNVYAENSKRKISGQEIQNKMFDINRTFWDYKQIDRFYFTTDGKLQHQINEPRGNIRLGSVLDAEWEVKGDNLCWTYIPATQKTYGFKNQELCFDLYTRETPDEFMIGNHPQIELKQVGARADSSNMLRFYSWHRGDYIYDPKYVPAVYKGMKTMAEYRSKYKGRIPGGSIKREDMKSFMKDYYDIAIGNIFAIDRDYMYFLPNGDFYHITGERIDEAHGDLDKMLKLASKGSWAIKNNIHCWAIDNSSRSSCEFVFPPRKGLKNRKFSHFLGTFHTGMTRIHNDNVEHVRHITPEQSELPALFKKMAEASGYTE